jgi:sigma-B regulation protein RsbU (phosphoserine phosphatase)
VAGHGIASAMMTARLAALLSGGSPDQNIAMSVGAYGRSEAWPPEMVAHRLNRMMTEGFAVDQYFTMAYAEIDLFTGQVRLVQAGHPHPLVMRAAGGVEKIGAGGMPIGLIEGCSYDRVTFSLSRGDRLFLMSDGITECPNPQGEELGVDGLISFLNKNKGLKSVALLEALMWDLSDFAGQPDFPDDVSGILFDYRGPG